MCETQTNREAFKNMQYLTMLRTINAFNFFMPIGDHNKILTVNDHHEGYIYAFLLARGNGRKGEIPNQ